MIVKPFDRIFTVKEHFHFFLKIFKKMLKMDKVHLFSPNYFCMLKRNVTKWLCKYLGEHICWYLYLKQISSFMRVHATALHSSKVELR